LLPHEARAVVCLGNCLIPNIVRYLLKETYISKMTEEQVVGSPEVVIGSPERDILVKPIVRLEKVDLTKNEDNEKELYKMRAKLYRYFVDEEDGSMWKERGVGDVRILNNTESGTYRVLMRRDKTLKLCLNHFLLPNMEIKNHATNDKALLWSTPADFADGESKPETLCIRFGKTESASDFKAKFEECVRSVINNEKNKDESSKLADALSGLDVKEEKDKNDNTKDSNKNTESAKKSTDDKKDEESDK